MNDALPRQVETLCETIRGLDRYADDEPTLVYFDIIGIAWPIRCLLHLNEVDYRLIQISIDKWTYRNAEGEQVVKGSFPNGHVPLYVDKEVRLNQSNLIMSWLAEKYGMAGDTAKEKLAVAEVMGHAYDALFHWNGLFQVLIKMGIPDDVVDSRREAFMGNGVWGLVSNGYRNHLDAFVRYLQANPADSGFIVGHSLSIADLHAFNILCNWYKAFSRETFVAEYPILDDYIRRIAAIPKVGDYIDNRQEPTTWFELPQIAIRLTSPEELQGLVGPAR